MKSLLSRLMLKDRDKDRPLRPEPRLELALKQTDLKKFVKKSQEEFDLEEFLESI